MSCFLLEQNIHDKADFTDKKTDNCMHPPDNNLFFASWYTRKKRVGY